MQSPHAPSVQPALLVPCWELSFSPGISPALLGQLLEEPEWVPQGRDYACWMVVGAEEERVAGKLRMSVLIT